MTSQNRLEIVLIVLPFLHFLYFRGTLILISKLGYFTQLFPFCALSGMCGW